MAKNNKIATINIDGFKVVTTALKEGSTVITKKVTAPSGNSVTFSYDAGSVQALSLMSSLKKMEKESLKGEQETFEAGLIVFEKVCDLIGSGYSSLINFYETENKTLTMPNLVQIIIGEKDLEDLPKE